ncbi:MAG TPA: HlyD family secretion protein [Syntrophales bacterium]|jgi:membrane fusion protein (multidrug efflux system)|nr:HlyD family secretion protein [Syntrophales bacterium]HOX95349.1 HlyD family secretion protein [Syntrophales bacterium]HPI58268.1 HlyD family secretion protein [Syntrophales bacterium]HPN26086.1 HlyD family secretion protein [Syntrophales bacterium]HQM30462.1 HlyD family secretion protein [Syntrophales bacterium]
MTAAAGSSEGPNSNNDKTRKRKILVFSILAVIVAAVIVSSLFYFEYRKTHVTTDDAFVDGRVYLVASKIPGTVKALHVTDNQMVKKGDTLVEIDPADYEVRVLETQANLEVGKNQLIELQAALDSARAGLEAQESMLRKAEIDFQRADSLVKEDLVTKEFFDQKKTALEVAQAQLKSARELVRKTEASLGTQRALIRQARSTLQGAELNQSYTKILAPADGYVTKRNVEAGNRVQTGQPLLAVVSLAPGDVWITANYKETDLTRVKPGQKVRIRVDTYPGKVLHGRVESIMAGTGAVFSLFPPENATGNYVKVVQRIPVKIVLDESNNPAPILRIGMSVEPTILIDR